MKEKFTQPLVNVIDLENEDIILYQSPNNGGNMNLNDFGLGDGERD